MYCLGYLSMRAGFSMVPYLEANKDLLSSHWPIPKTATHNQLTSYNIINNWDSTCVLIGQKSMV